MRLAFRSAARRDIVEIVRYYEAQSLGLGRRFFDAVEDATVLLCQHPRAGAAVGSKAGIRELQLKKFPYRMLYRLESNEIAVLAIAHQKRKPAYWAKYVQEEPAIYQLAA